MFLPLRKENSERSHSGVHGDLCECVTIWFENLPSHTYKYVQSPCLWSNSNPSLPHFRARSHHVLLFLQMRSISHTAALAATLASVSSVNALPSSTTNPCYVTQYTAIPAAVASCTDITLDNIHVPGGQTLDLTALQDGTTVTFAGTTTFGFEEANYNLIEASGVSILFI